MTTIVTIDRFEDEYAILELAIPSAESDETEIIMMDFPKFLLPETAKEGSILNLSLELNELETKKREANIKSLMNDLFD